MAKSKFKNNAGYKLTDSRYRRRQGIAASDVRGPKAGPDSVNRRLGIGSLGFHLNDDDGVAGRSRDESRRGRDSGGYDALGFDKSGLNDDRESKSDLLRARY